MSFFKDHQPIEGVKDILKLNRPAGRALVHYHTAVMRQDSELSVRDRELLAAYVSGLNACQYCHGVHSVTAQIFGVKEELLDDMLDDISKAELDEKLRPILLYVKQLTLQPSKLTQELADKVIAAGWSEQALHDAINVASLFNFMNRLVEGHGVKGESSLYEQRGEAVGREGYDALLKHLESEK